MSQTGNQKKKIKKKITEQADLSTELSGTDIVTSKFQLTDGTFVLMLFHECVLNSVEAQLRWGSTGFLFYTLG